MYVLSNPSMPGIVKIGRSIHGGKSRAKDFYRNDTAVATPFELVFEMYCEDCEYAETEAHKTLKCYRVNVRREFFRVDTRTAINAVLSSYMAEFHQLSVTLNEFSFDKDCLYLSYGEKAYTALGDNLPFNIFSKAVHQVLNEDDICAAALRVKNHTEVAGSDHE